MWSLQFDLLCRILSAIQQEYKALGWSNPFPNFVAPPEDNGERFGYEWLPPAFEQAQQVHERLLAEEVDNALPADEDCLGMPKLLQPEDIYGEAWLSSFAFKSLSILCMCNLHVQAMWQPMLLTTKHIRSRHM